MRVKDWLMRAYRVDQEIAALERARRDAWDGATSATPGDGATTGGSRDMHRLDRYAVLAATIDERLAALAAARAEIVTAIGRLPDARHRTLLRERYVNFRTWTAIADDMRYSPRRVMQLHREALAAMDEALREKRLH